MRWRGGWTRWAGLGVLVAGLSGCGVRHRSSMAVESIPFEPGDHVTNEDIQEAFEAGPRLPEHFRVAVFTSDDVFAAALEQVLIALPQVTGVYRIPPLIASGQRRLDPPRQGGINIRALRLMAARARADVVLIADYGHQTQYGPNGLALFGVALLPIFVLPIQDVETTSYVDGYLIDTRSGYLYGQLSSLRRGVETFVTIYSSAGDDLVIDQRNQMVAETGGRLRALIKAQRAVSQHDRWTPAGTGPVPVPTDTEDPWAKPQIAKVALTAAGDVQLQGRSVGALEDLVDQLGDMVKRGPVEVIIQADEDVPYRQIVEVIDRLRQLGVAKVSFAVAPSRPQSPSPNDAELPASQPSPKPPAAPDQESPPESKLPPKSKLPSKSKLPPGDSPIETPGF